MLKIAICDDEIRCCAKLEYEILEYSKRNSMNIECETYSNIASLYNNLQHGYIYDLIFLDIEFSDRKGNTDSDGIKLGQMIRNDMLDESTQIVFMSWHDRYSLQLHGIHILDFARKPVSTEKLEAIIERLIRIRDVDLRNFTYNINKGILTVSLSDVSYFKSNGRQVQIYDKNNELKDQFNGKLSDVWPRIKNADFLFIHNRYIVNYKYVRNYEYSCLTVGEKREVLPIAQSRRKEIRKIQMRMESESFHG